jgi:selenocysteine-specific elongation factor
LVLIVLRRLEPCETQQLMRESGLEPEIAKDAVDALMKSGDAIPLPGAALTGVRSCTAPRLAALTARLKQTLVTYHRQSPLRPGIPREELRGRLGLASRPFEQVLGYVTSAGEAKEAGAAVALPEYEAKLNNEQETHARAFLESLQTSPFSPPADPSAAGLDEELLTHLEARGDIVRVSDDVAFAAEAYREMVERVVSRAREHGQVTLAEVRDMLGTSRKYAQALLEQDERIAPRWTREARGNGGPACPKSILELPARQPPPVHGAAPPGSG